MIEVIVNGKSRKINPDAVVMIVPETDSKGEVISSIVCLSSGDKIRMDVSEADKLS